MGEDYSKKIIERSGLISFLDGLHSSNPNPDTRGGFENDLSGSFQSISYLYDNPILFSSYYFIKGLEILGFEASIDIDMFEEYLSRAYVNDSNTDYFKVSFKSDIGDFSIPCSAIGLDLSGIYNFPIFSIDRSDVINFILNGRNSDGLWKRSNNYSYAELIDTYQIIHALNEAGEISNLGSEEKDKIAFSMQKFHQFNGFSLILEDYTSLDLKHTMILFADLLNKLPQLNHQEIFNQIEGTFTLNRTNTGFYANVKMESKNNVLRSYPKEYFTYGKNIFVAEYDDIKSHKSAFLALDSLAKIFKIDEFGENYLIIG